MPTAEIKDYHQITVNGHDVLVPPSTIIRGATLQQIAIRNKVLATSAEYLFTVQNPGDREVTLPRTTADHAVLLTPGMKVTITPVTSRKAA